MATSSKAEALAAEVNKILGTDALRLGNDPAFVVRYLPTGVAPIDYLLGGGIPRNRMTEISGFYSTLKSYIGLKAIAETQRSGGLCGLVDSEHTFDPVWAGSKSIGVDVKSLLLPPTATGEEAVDATEALIRAECDLIVWDSIAATLPKAEQQMQLGGDKNVQPARLAALMSTALRKLNTANSKTALLFINQTRINVGQMFGNPEVTPGGRAMLFYASHRIIVRKAGQVNSKIKTVGPEGDMVDVQKTDAQHIKAVLEKSKLTTPHREVLFTFVLDGGYVDDFTFLVGRGIETGLISRPSNVKWKMGRTEITGKEKFFQWLKNNDKAMADLRTNSLGSPQPHKNGDAPERRLRLRKPG